MTKVYVALWAMSSNVACWEKKLAVLLWPHSPIWFFVICAGVNKVNVFFRRKLLFLSLPGSGGNDLKQRSGNVNIWSVKSELALLEGGAN